MVIPLVFIIELIVGGEFLNDRIIPYILVNEGLINRQSGPFPRSARAWKSL